MPGKRGTPEPVRIRRTVANAARTIADVAERMREILDDLPPADGVACFTRLYLAVTEAVDEAKTSFAAPAFLTQLDLCFAGLYFQALDDPPRASGPKLCVMVAWPP